MTIIVFCLALVSCGQVSMEDVSAYPKYADMVGMRLKLKQDVWALGITSDSNYKKRVDYIVLVPGVGFSGPEVVTRERSNMGTVFEVTRVLKAKFPLSRMEYIVTEVNSRKFKYEIHIDLTEDLDDQSYGLDRTVYSIEDR